MIGTRSEAPIDYIVSTDPALDTVHPDFDWAEYLKTFDPKYAPTREGCIPTVFEIRRLTRKQLTYVRRKDTADQVPEAIAYALRRVRGFRVGGKNGVELECKHKRSDMGERLDEETLDKLYAPELFAELAGIIMGLAGLDPTLGRD